MNHFSIIINLWTFFYNNHHYSHEQTFCLLRDTCKKYKIDTDKNLYKNLAPYNYRSVAIKYDSDENCYKMYYYTDFLAPGKNHNPKNMEELIQILEQHKGAFIMSNLNLL